MSCYVRPILRKAPYTALPWKKAYSYDQPQQERLLFLAKVVRREIKHLQSTDNRLFAQPLTPALVAQLDSDEDLAERVEAFISRFGRLQDTLGDKLLPNLLAFVGERTATAVDNLDRAERLGWIKSSDSWLETRKA